MGRTRGIILHLSKYNYQRIEPSPISVQTVPFKSVASMSKGKVSHICNSLAEDSLCQLPWPCCAPQHDCKGGLGLTKSQEIIASGKQFPSPRLPSPTTKKNNVLNSSCFIWGLSSSEHICIFTVWGFYLTILSDF